MYAFKSFLTLTKQKLCYKVYCVLYASNNSKAKTIKTSCKQWNRLEIKWQRLCSSVGEHKLHKYSCFIWISLLQACKHIIWWKQSHKAPTTVPAWYLTRNSKNDSRKNVKDGICNLNTLRYYSSQQSIKMYKIYLLEIAMKECSFGL